MSSASSKAIKDSFSAMAQSRLSPTSLQKFAKEANLDLNDFQLRTPDECKKTLALALEKCATIDKKLSAKKKIKKKIPIDKIIEDKIAEYRGFCTIQYAENLALNASNRFGSMEEYRSKGMHVKMETLLYGIAMDCASAYKNVSVVKNIPMNLRHKDTDKVHRQVESLHARILEELGKEPLIYRNIFKIVTMKLNEFQKSCKESLQNDTNRSNTLHANVYNCIITSAGCTSDMGSNEMDEIELYRPYSMHKEMKEFLTRASLRCSEAFHKLAELKGVPKHKRPTKALEVFTMIDKLHNRIIGECYKEANVYIEISKLIQQLLKTSQQLCVFSLHSTASDFINVVPESMKEEIRSEELESEEWHRPKASDFVNCVEKPKEKEDLVDKCVEGFHKPPVVVDDNDDEKKDKQRYVICWRLADGTVHKTDKVMTLNLCQKLCKENESKSGLQHWPEEVADYKDRIKFNEEDALQLGVFNKLSEKFGKDLDNEYLCGTMGRITVELEDVIDVDDIELMNKRMQK